MPTIALTLETIRQLEPALAEAFEQEFALLVKDCSDRPGLKTARKMGIEITLKPLTGIQAGLLENVSVAIELTSKRPKKGTAEHIMAPRRDGTLVFNPHSPDVRQGSFLGDDDE